MAGTSLDVASDIRVACKPLRWAVLAWTTSPPATLQHVPKHWNCFNKKNPNDRQAGSGLSRLPLTDNNTEMVLQVCRGDQLWYPHVLWPLRWTIAHSTWMIPLHIPSYRKNDLTATTHFRSFTSLQVVQKLVLPTLIMLLRYDLCKMRCLFAFFAGVLPWRRGGCELGKPWSIHEEACSRRSRRCRRKLAARTSWTEGAGATEKCMFYNGWCVRAV